MKTSKLFRQAIAVLGAVIAFAGVGGTAASAHDDSLYDTPEVRAFYTKYGVDEATQQRLIASMENGDLIDAMTAGAEPVSVRAFERDGSSQIVHVYQDGSVAVTALENPEPASPGMVGPLAVNGCTVSSGTGFITGTNCLVSHSSAYATLKFRANYTRTASYTGCKVWGQNSPSASATIGVISDISLSLVRGTATSNQPAVATMHAYLSGGSISEDLYLSIRVNPSQVWTTTY